MRAYRRALLIGVAFAAATSAFAQEFTIDQDNAEPSTGGRSAAVASQSPDSAWTIGSRTLSAPVGASDALRAAIANTPQPN